MNLRQIYKNQINPHFVTLFQSENGLAEVNVFELGTSIQAFAIAAATAVETMGFSPNDIQKGELAGMLNEIEHIAKKAGISDVQMYFGQERYRQVTYAIT